MSGEDIALLGLALSSLITIVGWGATAVIQQRILKQTNKAQRIEREVAVFRERLSTVRAITSSLLDQMGLYTQLVAMVLSGQFNKIEGGRIIGQLNTKGLELFKLLYDPGFRAIQGLLPEEHSKLIFDQLKKATDLVTQFHAEAAPLGSTKPITPAYLQSLAAGAMAVSREFVTTANMFADAFAVLDRNLASGVESSAA